MPYVKTETKDGIVFLLPEEHRDDDAWTEASQALLSVAFSHYNRALHALRTGDIPTALADGYQAIHFFPYSPELVELGLALSIKHGDYKQGRQLIGWADHLGLHRTVDFYSGELQSRAAAWNAFLSDRSKLRSKYQKAKAEECYRELLLLSEQGSSLTEQEKSYLQAYGLASGSREQEEVPQLTPWGWQKFSAFGMAALLAGVVLGVGSIWSGILSIDLPLDDPEENVSAAEEELQRLQEENESLAHLVDVQRLLIDEGPLVAYDSAEALQVTATVTAEDTAQLFSSIRKSLYQRGIEAWQEEDYDGVVRHLSRLQDHDVGDPLERNYYLGVAAHRTGQSNISTAALELAMDHMDPWHEHFEAQAAYLLATQLDTSAAERYAELLRDRYPNTIYYNSTIQSLLYGR